MPSSTSYYDVTKLTPRQIVEQAAMWASKDYPAPDCRFRRLVDLCEEAKLSGVRRLRRGDVFYLARAYGFDMSICDEFKFDNNIWSALSRYLLMYRPSLAAIIKPRKADIDHVDFRAVWSDVVGIDTRWLADSWQEAQLAYEVGDVSAA